MYLNFYKKITLYFQTHPKGISILNIFNKCLTLAGFILYPVLLAAAALHTDKRFFAFLFIPAFCFFFMSQIRKLINRPRPYEKYDIQPLICREGHGQSFPSRHVFSIFLIGALWYGYFAPVGVLLFLFGILLACVRVAAGVHFLSDVLWGAFLGLLCGYLSFAISSF